MKKLFSNINGRFASFRSKLKDLRLRSKAGDFFKRLPAFVVKHKLVFTGAAFVLVTGVILISFAAVKHKAKNEPEKETPVTIANPYAANGTASSLNQIEESFIVDSQGQFQISQFDPKGFPKKGKSFSFKPPVEPNKTGTTGESPVLVKTGEHDERIPDVQEKLMDLWYMDYDEPTDYLGAFTSAALEAFQRVNDLKITGNLNAETYHALSEPDAKAYFCSVGDFGPDVEELQSRLYELGYYEKVTGLFNEKTEEAVIQFQKANALTADGRVGRETKEQLYNPHAKPNVLSLSSQGDIVLKCQKKLDELGYLTTNPDGNFGKDTQMAVRRFQEQNSLIVDGYLGPTTRRLLLSSDAKGNALSYGMRGSDVQNVQTRLYKLNYLEAKYITGYYVDITEIAVRLFQKNNSLQVDGKVGRNTMNRLFSDSAIRAKRPVKPGEWGGGTGSRIDKFINIAKSRLGCPYVRGAKGPNAFDCSGLVYWCMNQAGISQPYLTSLMWRSCGSYPRNTNINNIKRGDVIVYKGHVAIALGNWVMIDASRSKGKVVRRGFNSNWFRRNFICSYRIFGG